MFSFHLILSSVKECNEDYEIVRVLRQLRYGNLDQGANAMAIAQFGASVLLCHVKAYVLRRVARDQFEGVRAFRAIVIGCEGLGLSRPIASGGANCKDPSALLSRAYCHSVRMDSLFRLYATCHRVIRGLRPRAYTFVHLYDLIGRDACRFILNGFVQDDGHVRPINVNTVELSCRAQAITFPFLLACFDCKVDPILSFHFLYFQIFSARSTFGNLLPFVAPPLGLFGIAYGLIL